MKCDFMVIFIIYHTEMVKKKRNNKCNNKNLTLLSLVYWLLVNNKIKKKKYENKLCKSVVEVERTHRKIWFYCVWNERKKNYL